VAVSVWKKNLSGEHVVVVYRGSGAVWEAVLVIGGGFGSPGICVGQLDMPYGLRFSRDGSAMCVAETGNGRASVFRVAGGGFVRHVATGLDGPYDVEEVEDGWLVACGAPSHSVQFVCGGVGSAVDGRASLGKTVLGAWDGEPHDPIALAVVPGLGLVVRDLWNRHLQVFTTQDTMAMAAMSPDRVAWMAVVMRAGLRRQRPLS
jgi:hypothetical protein